MNLFSLSPRVPFLDAIAAEWLGRDGDSLDLARGLILLPTRRAARALAEAFLRVSGGRPLLLPRITALGALDEAPLALDGTFDVPPAVEPAQRLAALARLILAMDGADGAPRTADRAWPLAEDLAALMDEAERAEIDLATRLPDAADPAYADHWAQTLRFLHIVTGAWPVWLREQGLMNPAARQVALLDAQAACWERAPPADRVLVAGTTGGIPAVARLTRVVARLPGGGVLLPGLDTAMDDAVWAELGDGHPQAGLKRLLAGMGATRGDVRTWPMPGLATDGSKRARTGMEVGQPGRGPPIADEVDTGGTDAPNPGCGSHVQGVSGTGEAESSQWDAAVRPGATVVPKGRVTLLGRALLPGAAIGAWSEPAPLDTGELYRLTPADQQEEAVAIALILRDALETRGARAALVTPDRDLAGRVAAELLRWGVVADDSAGEALADTPPAVFLRLLARALAEQLAPVPLLALLKHPLAAAGLSAAACRTAARSLELVCLRGPRPGPGLSGLRRALDRTPAGPSATDLLRRLESCFAPALRSAASVVVAPAEAIAALVASAEALAATDAKPGPARLWSGEEGEALATRLAAVQDALPMLPEQPRAAIPGLLDAVLRGEAVHTRRALRGRDGQTFAEHPRVFIWGLLEARLQAAEVLVLGGLAEGVWPPATDPGPWLSRPMRQAVGLPSPEEAVGQAAHDFVSAACAAATVVLSCPARRDGAPAVPARWLTRLEMMLQGQGGRLPDHPAAAWARALDQPAGGPVPVDPPRPCPPLALRPRRLSVTEIETWLRDPYAIYARHVLKLTALKPLDEATDAAEYGMLVHAGLHRFLEKHGAKWPPNAAQELQAAMLRALHDAGLRGALAAWWTPRLERIAAWVADAEATRRSQHPLDSIASEVKGDWTIISPAHPFRLTGRADRIERRADGSLVILDYKTGTPPSQSDVESGCAPQLLLEAAMAAEGAFGPGLRGAAVELAYWHLTGGFHPGEAIGLFKSDAARIAAAVHKARENLAALIEAYDDPARCYLSHPHPSRAPRFSDYAQLARVAEWAAAGDEA